MKKTWKVLKEESFGAIIKDAGNSREFKTGSWRTKKPVWNENACIHCLFCWLYCPDSCIIVENGKMKGIDYNYCKGCGLCASVCPTTKKGKAIKMEEEVL